MTFLSDNFLSTTDWLILGAVYLGVVAVLAVAVGGVMWLWER